METTKDMVNHPSHYNHNGLETIDVIRAWLSHPQFIGYLTGNLIKYISRWQDKNGLEDLKKAQWYLNRLIEEKEKFDDNFPMPKPVMPTEVPDEKVKKGSESFSDGKHIPLPEEMNNPDSILRPWDAWKEISNFEEKNPNIIIHDKFDDQRFGYHLTAMVEGVIIYEFNIDLETTHGEFQKHLESVLKAAEELKSIDSENDAHNANDVIPWYGVEEEINRFAKKHPNIDIVKEFDALTNVIKVYANYKGEKICEFNARAGFTYGELHERLNDILMVVGVLKHFDL